MNRSYGPHSIYGCDPDTGLPRELPSWMRDRDYGDDAESAARAAAVEERYRFLDERRRGHG